MNWLDLVKTIALVALSSHPRTASIANEVAAAIPEAEKIFGPGSGEDKLQHVLNVAKSAAQATDELKGGADDVPGHVSAIVSAAVTATNEIVAAAKPAA